MKTFAILPILICSILLPTGADAEIYKWLDKSGNPHFSDTPPPSGKTVYDIVKEGPSSSRNELEDHLQGVHFSTSKSALYSGKPLYFWRDQLETLNSKIAMRRKDILLLKSAIDKTDMYKPEKRSGMIIYPRELRVDGRLLNTRVQFIEEWNRQTEQLRELEEEFHNLRNKAKLAGVPRWVWEDESSTGE